MIVIATLFFRNQIAPTESVRNLLIELGSDRIWLGNFLEWFAPHESAE